LDFQCEFYFTVLRALRETSRLWDFHWKFPGYKLLAHV